ncbi:papain fold toxin domain-containing protein [Dolichospermum circinale]|uniref:papain fold toxin domain-containing protein n=1 Tax=Dolichospermum circinale TaxID=109265 RepID=UPI0004246A0E|nr:papain fold toxin domain-containing protein [Dolichospermum circinale]MDB9482517.1 papain fold toxin domain-containing protein [Dolichospermum circinale CS-537/05]MDB9452841.1 papain fold toxin domain-containing protein [Dolichospermum circinale CS-541/06]MDB9462079.1 papain fold toxin domain-containing protein [Dolichospermum circinale CS-541/04]MDB9474648.1 papain fold toxin domain-containing protein [Dolichospermum circinale CS-537/11]MDB9478891.1 papain fold toxin domain-containing prot
MKYLTLKQKQDLVEIADSYPNLQCVQCALAIKNYLQLARIPGKLIKINTQADLDYRNCFFMMIVLEVMLFQKQDTMKEL